MTTIWITGGKGFIGRHLARHCAERGASVLGIGHGLWPPDDAANWSYCHWINGEIESSNLSQLAHTSGPPDTVFHLAGGSSVGISLQNPLEDFTRTVETTARLLEWTRIHAPDTKIVAVSSAAVYGAGHLKPIHEHAPITPYSPYGYHKSMMETLCRSYGENFGLKTGVVRLFSVYGPGLEKQLIWDLCRKLHADRAGPLTLGGTGEEMRDWIHVSDAVELLWLARGACDRKCAHLNGGTGIGIAIKEAAAEVLRAWGASPQVVFNGMARRGDPGYLVAEILRARGLGFDPRVAFSHGVQSAVDWFRSSRGGSLHPDTRDPHVR
jgi:UDP-glucose 4-epimerase